MKPVCTLFASLCGYPGKWACTLDEGRDLKKDHFYHGLCPYLHDALSFVMAGLPKREQACPTYDTLYTLLKNLEAGQPVWARHYIPTY